MASLRRPTPYEQTHSAQEKIPEALRMYLSNRKDVGQRGLTAVFGKSQAKIKLYNRGAELYKLGFRLS